MKQTGELRLIACATLLLSPAFAQDQDPPQGAALLKTDILCVLAHPDDETGMAATLAHYAHGQDKRIANVYCTRGEGGGNMVGTHWGPALGILRESELAECLQTLGVRHTYFLEQLDWAYTESVAMTLKMWDHEECQRRLVRFIRCLRPEIILTMNPFPRPGQHGHHQAAGMLAIEAFEMAADPTQFPKQIEREGLEPWQARKLFFRGEGTSATVVKIDAGVRLPNGSTGQEIAGKALSNHRSQGFGRMRRATFARPPESYSLIKSVIAPEPEESDFFTELPLLKNDIAAVIPPPAPAPENPHIAFAPRPAVDAFLTWAKRYAIDHLMSEVPSDIPVVCGTTNRLTLRIKNPNNKPADIAIKLTIPEGWEVTPASVSANIAANTLENLTITIKPPKQATKDVKISATGTLGSSKVQAETVLHPLPLLEIASPTPHVPITTPITPAHRVQGKVTDEADSSASFQVTYDQEHLHVTVDVRDERIVSNIAPNDIRGHWRSDAVEICVDPTGKAEHTLDCFKVGIFPFDQAGNVRAARDADANQGPIEETAPGMQLASERTESGYRIRTAVPWQDIGTNGPPKNLVGFNIILYDGDKADAAPGEYINESRLAWSPRSGVQGRPEDWGRLLLK